MNLNDLKQIKKLDPGCLAESLALLPEQIKSVRSEAEKIKFPADYAEIDEVVVFGMGGSNLSARIISSLFKDELKVPLIIAPGYDVPGFVDKKTLCILSSYSGNTEETLSVLPEIKKRKVKIVAIGASLKDSLLKESAEKDKIPGLFFDSSANYSNQPRAGLGYSLFGLLSILLKIKVLKISSAEMDSAAKKAQEASVSFDTEAKNNKAKVLAEKISGQGVVILGGDLLEGSFHALRNQINENGKNFSTYLVLPEMNHYALEGLSFPAAIKKELIFLAFNSDLYNSRIKQRLELTKKVIKKNGFRLVEYSLSGRNKLEQAAEMLAFGGWLTFYLGILNGVNPSLIPWVDWFKKELKKNKKTGN